MDFERIFNLLFLSFNLTSTQLHASSEYIKLSGSSPGPDLPITMYDEYAIVAINRTHSMVVGGLKLEWQSYVVDWTYFYDHGNQQWIHGPKLIQARQFHAVGIVNDKVTMTNLVIVTGGYLDYNLDSTEILVDNQWLPGKKQKLYKNIFKP